MTKILCGRIVGCRNTINNVLDGVRPVMLIRDKNVREIDVRPLAGGAPQKFDSDGAIFTAIPFPDLGAGIAIDQRVTVVRTDTFFSSYSEVFTHKNGFLLLKQLVICYNDHGLTPWPQGRRSNCQEQST